MEWPEASRLSAATSPQTVVFADDHASWRNHQVSKERREIDTTIVILADGVRPDVLRSLAAAGEIPHVARRFYEEGLNSDNHFFRPVASLGNVTEVSVAFD